MGKKRIYFHLLIFCAVSTVSCHIYSSGALEYLDNAFATGPFSCAHDGYEKDDGCICKSHFTSSSCTQRVCMNEGIRRSPSGDQGCKCPPGFLGTSCEPVQCIPGDSHSFYEEVEKQSIYVLVTYNTFMNKTIQTNKDDPILAVCQAVQNLTIAKRFWSLNAQIIEIRKTSDVEECVDDAKSWCDPPAVCDPGVLTVSDINAIIDQSEANSQVLIITNTALDEYNVDDTIRKAISRRIKVHVIAFAPEIPIFTKDFNTLPGYTALRSIADATFGFFITPYAGSSNALMGTTTASEAILQIFDFISNNVAAVAVRPAITAQEIRSTVGRDKYYISFRSLGSEPQNITFLTEPTGLTWELDTGFWKLLSAQEKSGKTNFKFLYNGTGPGFNVQILSSYSLSTFVAVSSSDIIDASSPYCTIGAPRTVVARVSDKSIISGLSVNMSDGIQFTADIKGRSGCQFPLSLGTATCNQSTYGVLSVALADGTGSAVPFLCASEALPSLGNRMARLYRLTVSSNDKLKCSSQLTDSSAVEHLPLKRTFVIVARNVKDDNITTSSTVDNVFIYPNNIFDHLVPYMMQNPGYYTTFLANIFSTENPNVAFQTGDITSFMTRVMSTIHNATQYDRTLRYNYSLALQSVLDARESYSDVVVIVDSPWYGTFDESSLLEKISTKRFKIYFILVETYTAFLNKQYEIFSNLAVKSGGAAFRMPDYTSVRKYFDEYFNELTGKDMVSYKPFSNVKEYIETDPFSLSANSNYSAIFTSADASSFVTKASLYSNGADASVDLCPPEPIGKDLTFLPFRCSQVSPGTYTLRIYFSQNVDSSIQGNVVVFEKSPNFTVSVALSTNINGDGKSGTLYFNQPQYVAVKLVGSNTSTLTVTLKDENGTTLVDHVPTIQRDECLFPYALDYAWWCSMPNAAFQVQVDSTIGSSNITRTQILPCINKGGSTCVHGELTADQNCICDLGWEGPNCLTRICWNGGTTLPDNTCGCIPSEYDGEFCQISLQNCSSSPQSPYFANEVASLILVIERTTNPLNLNITSKILNALAGTQIVVVYYGGGLSPAVMLSTTDSQLLDIFLKQPPVEKVNRTAPPEAPYDALLLGMSTQLTARALVMLVSRGGDFPIAESFVKQLSLERAELRVFTEQASSNFTTLAMLGNGIPFVVSRDDFQQVYFPSYVVPIAAKATSLSSPVFNVIASDVSCNATIVIPAEDYSVTITLFAHVSSSNGATVEVQQGGSQPSPTRIGNSTYKFTIQSKVMTNISIRGSGQCSYSVEALNYYKIGYVFQRNNLDESGFVGPVQGLNYVSLSAANSLSNSDLSMMPLIQLRPITRNGTLGNAVLTTTTAKSSACTYSYFAELNCTQDLFGYQAQIQTSLAPNTRRQQQVIMTCLQLDSCKNGGQLKEGACVCDGWSGAECELPLCMNGGTRDGSVCICSANTFGELCEQKVPTHLNMVFILDSVGLDDTAFNSSITSILEFVSLYDIGNLRLMLIDNAKALPLNDGFVTYTTEALYSKLTGLFSYRNSMATIELDTVFSNISMQAKREQLTSAPNNFVFYVTQSGGKVQDLTSLADLRRSFTVSCIAISAYNQTLPSSVLDDLKQIGYTKTADNWYTAMKEMQGVTGSEDKQPPTQPPQPRCAGKQMSIFFAVDLSPGVDTYRDKMLAILNMFPTAFNLGYDILSGNTGCNEDGDITAAYSGSSRISGWSYYDRWLGVSNPTFCISNLASVMKSTQYDIGDDPVPTINGTKGLLKRFTTLLTNTCLCSRYNDTSVTKAVIWMPIANYTFDGYTDLLNTPYVHYVIPLSFQPQEGDFYYGLSQNNGKMDGLLHGAESSTSDSIVNDLWSILCG